MTKSAALPSDAAQVEKLALEVEAGDRVERRERFVEQEQGRVGRERPCDPDALLLTAGKLPRVAGAKLRGV